MATLLFIVHRVRLILVLAISLFSTLLLTGPVSADTSFYLPWEDGDSWMVSQGYDGITHQRNALYGFDFWKPGVEGKPVLAAAEGLVVRVVNSFTESTWPNKPFLSGNVVIIRHDDGTYTQYAHLQKEKGEENGANGFVKVGERIKRGSRIGSIGTTGSSSGPHLHFQRQTGGSEESQSIPISFVDVRGNNVVTNKWYTPDPSLRDTTPPAAGLLLSPKNEELLSNRNIVFRWTPAVEPLGIAYYNLKIGKDPDFQDNPADVVVNYSTQGTTNPLTTSNSVALPESAGQYYWTVIAVNPAGLSTAYQKGYFQLDPEKPTGSLIFSNESENTVDTRDIQLVVQASDKGSGVWGMLLSENPGFEGASWETLKTKRTWQLTEGSGQKKIYSRFMDRAGNISETFVLDIKLQLPAAPNDSTLETAMNMSTIFADWLS